LRRFHDRWGFSDGEGKAAGTGGSAPLVTGSIDYNVHMLDEEKVPS
jgi:hypothetical protein